ncbi:GntR family transcriptional regulator [Prosthecomicrobium hirschii]|uniref:GntR family transcriptional regulator n=1 Tax=Prosthecodimorpha hirschii TaxID=665126 RepID=A0A0P6VP80_9HYPH|nr:GntR family transcriptional regulator [Prosthecomicrobium hirschii]KPL53648.1 GntR family transcriptional regulator [Prosthecomicrobium hirschii]MCW1842756.1 GntR family transcriptional regulator [Prosthecomicrobium hirschii]TPQ52634.1 GntR family transcriptional regulator [Prosthecomicrobium hirschii]
MTNPRAAREGGEPKLRDLAYASFTERLLAREIKPGQFVSQRELVEITGLPLGAIRELIPRLEAEGLITTVPQRGMQVAHVDIDLIRNAFQFRLFLEREATALFAAAASADLVAALRRAHEEIVARAKAGGDPDLVRDAEEVDRRLHQTIIDHLDNAIISQAYRVNWIKIKLIRRDETRLYENLIVPVMADHLKVIAAIEARDPAAAAAAISDHITNARNRALDL